MLQEGPVHDVQWAPTGEYFVTVGGYMPARTNLFSSKCRMVHDLGAGPYNLVRWNPQVFCSLIAPHVLLNARVCM